MSYNTVIKCDRVGCDVSEPTQMNVLPTGWKLFNSKALCPYCVEKRLKMDNKISNMEEEFWFGEKK
jgi:hypothetical protein